MSEISLIPTESTHIQHFFKFESDPVAVKMAAFASLPKDFASFHSMWTRRIENPSSLHRTILLGEAIVGGIMSYEIEGHRCIGYWVDRNYWGKGVATTALKLFLETELRRPITATCVSDNIGSKRVLERNGFIYTHSERHLAPARTEKVEESFYILE